MGIPNSCAQSPDSAEGSKQCAADVADHFPGHTALFFAGRHTGRMPRLPLLICSLQNTASEQPIAACTEPGSTEILC